MFAESFTAPLGSHGTPSTGTGASAAVRSARRRLTSNFSSSSDPGPHVGGKNILTWTKCVCGERI